MLSAVRQKYEHTIYACYIGYITQAIVNNFAPLLFLTFVSDYGLSLDKITMITTVNFLVQLVVDLVSARVIDRVGYRRAVMFAHLMAAVGLIGMAVLPGLLGDAYAGILISVVCYAIGGGIIEVLISPIVEACPTSKKEGAMSLLHSFYCWGHLAVVLLSTLFFQVFGIGNWQIMAVIWAAVPVANLFYFSQVPIYPIVSEHEKLSLGGLLKNKMFWLIVVLMICAGASEQAMSQWASSFAESALKVSKTVGDLAGPCAFALCMGTARALYGKFSDSIPLRPAMGGLRGAVHRVLCGGHLRAESGAGPGGLRRHRLLCGNLLAGNLQRGSRTDPQRRDRHVRPAGPGRRSGLLQRPHGGGPGGKREPGEFKNRPWRGDALSGGDADRDSSAGTGEAERIRA